MASSGTYVYAPEIAEFVEESFERVGTDPAALTGRHARSARTSLNLLFSEWATQGVMPFVVEQMPNIAMVVNQPNYSVPVGTLAILDPIFIRPTGSVSLATPIQPISRGDYERIPNKTYSGLATNMFFDRPTLTFWTWPIGQFITDAIGYWRLRRIQDVVTASETPDVPYQLYEALASGLAAKLALKFNPPKFVLLKSEAAAAFKVAKDFERERAPTSFQMARI